MPPRPSLPLRTQTDAPSEPPADATKPDDTAIDDVYAQVDATGSLEAAARKLAAIAAAEAEDGGVTPVVVQRRQVWEDEDDEYFYRGGGGEAEEEAEEIEHLQEVYDGLWVGDLVAAMDGDGLRERRITNIVSLLRPRLHFESSFATYPVEIDDVATSDMLQYLPSTSAWIGEALARRAGEAITERSGDIAPGVGETTAGAVLVHCQAGMSRSATVAAAFLMRAAGLDPVEAVAVVREARPVVDPSETFWHQLGLYYLADGRVTMKDRATRQWYLERTTGMVMNQGAAPSTEHMARYPATPSASQPPTPSGGQGRRKIRCKMCRRHLAVREHMMDHILDQSPISRPRTPSNITLPGPLAMTAEQAPATEGVADVINPLTGLPLSKSRRGSSAGDEGRPRARSILGGSGAPEPMTSSASVSRRPSQNARPILDADQLAARLPPQLAALRAAQSGGASPATSTAASSPEASGTPLSAVANAPTPSAPPRRPSFGIAAPAPILVNPKCSGYFVEPLTWMEPVLNAGGVSGKLVCPNDKCGAKIGTFDWAGMQCGCREWVTPGFCIHRSKVDEVW
ncbi:Tyrosine-protein phosphatase YVH1 [Vanrija pseudolonga]|uniref:protein-tyrosine-phosphatase n=1 Tax=Vanrija pseudolonga TaxID=143232 RepID=A0AAF0XZZ0_9TREE|nr:Tyrosine-protein phosphatase YVH1 [Vanrija pseudolonga]